MSEVRNFLSVFDDVRAERVRQMKLWGEQNWPNKTGPQWARKSLYLNPHQMKVWNEEDKAARSHSWAMIFLEEVAEALAEENEERLRGELVQVAALTVQWIECLNRRRKK